MLSLFLFRVSHSPRHGWLLAHFAGGLWRKSRQGGLARVEYGSIFISHRTKDHAGTETMPSWLKQQGNTSYFIDYDEQSGIRVAGKERKTLVPWASVVAW
jgi:hypothetical protein